MFKLPVAQGHRDDNPIDVVDAALPKRRGAALRARNHRALPHAEVANSLATVDATDAWTGTRLAFRFLVFTAARNGEVRRATWEEIDIDRALWSIPATRTKAAAEHRVPLSDAALSVLDEACAIADTSDWCFLSVTGRPMSGSTLSNLLRENGVVAAPNGFPVVVPRLGGRVHTVRARGHGGVARTPNDGRRRSRLLLQRPASAATCSSDGAN